jgi:hypothetical protein
LRTLHGRANEGRISAVDAPLDRAQRAKCRNVHGPVGPGGRRNRGAWMFMSDKLMEMLPDKVVHYVGRDESASPATGSFKLHQIEEQELGTQVLGAPGLALSARPCGSPRAAS